MLQRHLTRLWGALWPVPAALLGAYLLALDALGGLRVEHGCFAVGVLAFAYLGLRSKTFLVEMMPYVLVAVGYDLVRHARQVWVTSERVVTCALQDLDRAMFSWKALGGVSAQEWLAAHPHPVLDLAFALPYACFAYAALAYAVHLYFADRARMRQFLWAFATANYLSFASWLLFPAAPPWYVHAHGCVADMNALPNAAGLLRTDAMLGIGYFATFYTRASSVYGAMPSMHNAYPLLTLFAAWPHATWRTKWIYVAYLAIMFGASLYLDHHWIVDALGGWVTAAVAWVVAPYFVSRVFGERRAVAASESLEVG